MAVAALHFGVLVRNGEPSGLDFGNWLTIGHHWLGTGAPGGSTSTYPPVVPLLAVAAVSAFGVPVGTAVLAALAGLAPAVATYLVLVRRVSQPISIAIAIVVASAGSTGEAVAWGGVPQLLGLGSGMLALATFEAFLRRPNRGAAWLCGGLVMLTGATTHLILAQLAGCLAALLALHLLLGRSGIRLRGPWLGRDGPLLHAARIATPVAPLIPLYVGLSRAVGQSFLTRSTTASWFSGTLNAFGGLFGDAPLLWKTATVLALLAPFALWHRRREPLWLLTATILYTDVASVAMSGESRLAYLAPLGIATGLGLLLGEATTLVSRTPRFLVVAAVYALASIAVGLGLKHFSAQRSYYGERLVPRGTIISLDWIREHTARGSLVAVAPVDALPFGWWVEGYGRRASLTGASELYLNFPQERLRARQAIALFGLTDATATQFHTQARDVGVDYLYVPSGWGGLSGTSLQRYIDAFPSAVVFENAAATIVRVAP